MTRHQTPKPAVRALGSIRSDEVMPLREAARRLGWCKKSIAHAKREGLQTKRFGRLDYVTGAAVLEFFATLNETPDAPGRQNAGGKETLE